MKAAVSSGENMVTALVEAQAGPDSDPMLEARPRLVSELVERTRQSSRAVLLVDSSPERLSWLTGQLSEHRCEVAESADEGMRLVESSRFDVLIAGARICSAKFLHAVAARGLSRSCIFLADGSELETLVNAYAAQHTFRVLSSDQSPEALRTLVHSLLYPREAERRALLGIRAELTCVSGGPAVSCSVLDLSNRGLAVRLDGSQGLLLPGVRISELLLYRGDERLIDRTAATVRYIEMLAPGARRDVAYKVGLELSRKASAPRDEIDSVLTEPARIIAMLQEGLRRGGLTVRVADVGGLVSIGRPAALDPKALEIRLEGEAPLDLAPGDVVEGRFDLAGSSFSFLSALARVDREPLGYSLRVPRALRVVRQRRFVRVRPKQESPVLVTVWSPFTGESSARPAIDITASGVAFPMEGSDLLPVGTRISRLRLRFSDGTELSCGASVRTLVAGEGASGFVCGVEFEGLSTADRTRIADAIVHAGRPELRDGTGTSFDALWEFFIDTRFVYPKKLETMRVDLVRTTMTRLLARPNEIMKTSLVVQDDRIQGHLSGVLAYRRTWLMQHLAARVAGKSTMTRGRLLNLAVIEYLEQLPHIEWIKLWYRPTNPWPARVFGKFASKLADPSLSHLRTYGYMVASTTSHAASLDPAIVVRAARASDHAWIEAYFVAARETVLLRSDDLTGEHLSLDSVRTAYEALELERRRVVLVAERHGRFVGFALLEVSSPGLNFSELTNAFRVFTLEPDEEARSALVASARAAYGRLGFERCIGLAADGDVDAYAAQGFELTRQYTCWTWHRSQYQGLFEHILKLRV